MVSPLSMASLGFSGRFRNKLSVCILGCIKSCFNAITLILKVDTSEIGGNVKLNKSTNQNKMETEIEELMMLMLSML